MPESAQVQMPRDLDPFCFPLKPFLSKQLYYSVNSGRITGTDWVAIHVDNNKVSHAGVWPWNCLSKQRLCSSTGTIMNRQGKPGQRILQLPWQAQLFPALKTVRHRCNFHSWHFSKDLPCPFLSLEVFIASSTSCCKDPHIYYLWYM